MDDDARAAAAARRHRRRAQQHRLAPAVQRIRHQRVARSEGVCSNWILLDLLLLLGSLSSALRLAAAMGSGYTGSGEDRVEFRSGECRFPIPWAVMTFFVLTIVMIVQRFAVRCGARRCDGRPAPPALFYGVFAAWTTVLVYVMATLPCASRYWAFAVWFVLGYLWFASRVIRRASDACKERDPDLEAELEREFAEMVAASFERAERARGVLAAHRRRNGGGLTDAQLAALPEVPAGEAASDEDVLKCAICLEPLEAGQLLRVMPACQHRFHSPCAADWLSRKAECPLCRGGVLVPVDGDGAEPAAAAAPAFVPPLLRQQGSRRISEVLVMVAPPEEEGNDDDDDDGSDAEDAAAADNSPPAPAEVEVVEVVAAPAGDALEDEASNLEVVL